MLLRQLGFAALVMIIVYFGSYLLSLFSRTFRMLVLDGICALIAYKEFPTELIVIAINIYSVILAITFIALIVLTVRVLYMDLRDINLGRAEDATTILDDIQVD